MKLLIMGVGYVGLPLVQELKASGHDLITTTTTASKIDHLRSYSSEVILLDGLHSTKLEDAISSCDGMMILIAPKASISYQETYLNTAKTVIAMLSRLNSKLHLIYTSSSSVYDNFSGEWATEDLQLQPQDKNAQILLQTEKEYLQHSHTCILRLGGIYGPERELVKRAKRLSGKSMPSSAKDPTNHIHQADIVAAIQFCLAKTLTGIYNLVNDSHIEKGMLYNNLCQAANLSPPQWEKSIPGGYKVSNQKIKDAGYILQHPLI